MRDESDVIRQGIECLRVDEPMRVETASPPKRPITVAAPIPKPSLILEGSIQIPIECFANPGIRTLSGDAFRLYLLMSGLAWKEKRSGGTLRASVAMLADATGLAPATVVRATEQLKKAMLLTCLERNYRTGNLWAVANLVGCHLVDDRDR
jgi:hypothetical protein